MFKVAVYGTLKKGKHNHHLMDKLGCTFLGDAKTIEKYPLIFDGRLPFLFEENGIGENISLEIYDVNLDALNALDKFEGHPYFYCRKEIECRFDNDELVKAYVYFSAGERSYFPKLPLLKNY